LLPLILLPLILLPLILQAGNRLLG
jgi:hypothetical protein